jgi:hypothetical protein
MSNKQVLIESLKKLGSAKAPSKIKDKLFSKPIVSNEGYKQGPPPTGSHYRIPGNEQGTFIYNPTPYALNLVGPNGTQAEIGPWDTTTQHFDEPYIDEFLSIKPGLEQSEDFMRKGGSAPKLPRKKNSRGYSRSLEATNKFFTENRFFAKPKSRKNKVYDPNAKYFQKGGATTPEEWGQQIKDIEGQIGNPADWTMNDYYLLQDKLNAYRDWRENTPEGQAVIDSHNEEGEYDISLPEHLQDYTNAMMKSKLAYANEFGNPAAQRMINIPDNPYDFGNGDTGTHYMASMDNYAVPQIQDENGQLVLGDYDPSSREAMMFDNPNDARYFAEHYKDVSPGFIEAKLTQKEIDEYRQGGYIVEDISVPQLTQAQNGKDVQSTAISAQDYVDAYNYSRKLESYMKNRLEYKPVKPGSGYYGSDIPSSERIYNDLNSTLNAWNKPVPDRTRTIIRNNILTNNFLQNNIPILDYYQQIDENKFRQRELLDGTINMDIPMAYYDKRIPVSEIKEYMYENDADGISDNVTIPMYNQQYLKDEMIKSDPNIQYDESGNAFIPQQKTVSAPIEEKKKTVSRSQTIMEPDPNKPGKFKFKETRLIPYATDQANSGWEDVNAPRVMYYNPTTGEYTEERFKDGGIIEDSESFEYELGDVVNKATMEKLKELGYTFEII